MRIDLATPAAPPRLDRLPRPPQAVVFDLDGTLIDSEALVLESYMEAARLHRVEFTREQFLSLVGRSREQSEGRMLEFYGRDFPLRDFHAAVSSHIGERAAPLKAGAAELLDHLDAARLPYALATSSGRGWVARHFTAHGLQERFHHVVTRDDVANWKPHPEPYLKASTALGYSPANILAIEDSPTGIRSAHAAGMMTVLAPDLILPDEETRAHAHLVVSSLHDVLALVQG